MVVLYQIYIYDYTIYAAIIHLQSHLSLSYNTHTTVQSYVASIIFPKCVVVYSRIPATSSEIQISASSHQLPVWPAAPCSTSQLGNYCTCTDYNCTHHICPCTLHLLTLVHGLPTTSIVQIGFPSIYIRPLNTHLCAIIRKN